LKLTINLISRGRPELLLRTVRRTAVNMALPETTFMVSLDNDDPTVTADLVDQLNDVDSRMLVSVRAREDSRGEKYDRALIEAPADIYLPTCDYSAMTTKGFDRLVVEAAQDFPDGYGMVYTHMANMSFPAYQAMTAKLVARMGYIYPHYFPFWFIDHWADDLARMIDRIAYADIACAPEPVNNGQHKTIGMRDLEFWTWLFDAARLHKRRQALDIINAPDFTETEWRKKLLARNVHLIEWRSYAINQMVRNEVQQIEAARGGVESEPDERYMRIKAKADVLFRKWALELAREAGEDIAA
jgi:hypothetical protein